MLAVPFCLSLAMSAARPSCASPAYASGEQPQNYVQNGGFERAGESWGWTCPHDWDASTSLDSTGRNAHSGRNSIKLKCSGVITSNKYGQIYQYIPNLAVGRTYYLEAWCKGIGVGSNELLSTGSKWQYHANIPSGTFGWTHIKVVFTADSTNETIMILLQDTTKVLWVDDISLSTEPIN